MDPPPLSWAKQLAVIAQNGLTYARDAYDRERYTQIQALAAEMLVAGTDLDRVAVAALLAANQGHATPKVGVRGVVFRDDAVLLVRERSDGRWTLPGGWSDADESPAEGTVREVLEESGYRTRAVRLLALHDHSRHGHGWHLYTIYDIFFLCEIISGAPSAAATVTAQQAQPYRPHRFKQLAQARRCIQRILLRRKRQPVLSVAALSGAGHQETDGVGFFRLDQLPELSTPRVTAVQIARFFDQQRHPEWPTDFD